MISIDFNTLPRPTQKAIIDAATNNLEATRLSLRHWERANEEQEQHSAHRRALRALDEAFVLENINGTYSEESKSRLMEVFKKSFQQEETE